MVTGVEMAAGTETELGPGMGMETGSVSLVGMFWQFPGLTVK